MSQRIVTSLLVLAAAAALLLACLLPPRIGHPVTPFMKSAAENRTGQPVTKLAVDASQPAVVIFVLPDCPCSIEYEPLVQRLYHAYGHQAAFIEVVAGDDQGTKEWQTLHKTPFPVLSDQDRKIAHEFDAKRSAYTAFVLNGKIIRLWPGYSAEMLQELGELIVTTTKSSGHEPDWSDAPHQLTSGCPLD